MRTDFLLLSAEGEKRRDQILLLAKQQAAIQARTRARRRNTIAGVAMGAIALSLSVWYFQQHQPERIALKPVPQPEIHKPEALKPTSIVPHIISHKQEKPIVVVRMIHTEPGVAKQFAIKPQAANWQRLNDDQLLTELAAAGKPAGLVWVDGKQRLWLGN